MLKLLITFLDAFCNTKLISVFGLNLNQTILLLYLLICKRWLHIYYKLYLFKDYIIMDKYNSKCKWKMKKILKS